MDTKDFAALRVYVFSSVPKLLGINDNRFGEIISQQKTAKNANTFAMAKRRGSIPNYQNFPNDFDKAMELYLKRPITSKASKLVQDTVRKNWEDTEKREYIRLLLRISFCDDMDDLLQNSGPQSPNKINEALLDMKPEFLKLPPAFAYALNTHMDAIASVHSDDQLFIMNLIKKNKKEIMNMHELLLTLAPAPSSTILERTTSKEWKHWTAIRSIIEGEETLSVPVKKSWIGFENKIQAIRPLEQLRVLSTIGLFWPDDAGKLPFGKMELDSLLLFKYLISDDAKQNILEKYELENNRTK
ncbi:hypothetical protein OBV_02340 [Oscillibacter valericigenes Sjm18-20]|nr:hypothetical protein OBV_02340 [Oscillibacter valericigenes Sjm18-20]